MTLTHSTHVINLYSLVICLNLKKFDAETQRRCEARTQHQRSRTHVRRGDVRGTPLPVQGTPLPCVEPRHATWFFFFSQLASTRTDSGRFTLNQADSGRNGRFKQKFKKNKKVQNGLFELNIKPYFSSLHTNTPNFSSLTLSLSITRLSLSLCSLPLSLLAVKHSTSAESVT